MLFEKAMAPLMQKLVLEGVGYATESWVRAMLENFFDGKREDGRVGRVVEEFVTENLVEAPTTEILRLSIMQYTFGYFVKDLVYKNRFRNTPRDYGLYKAHSKLAFANALIQWKLMCEQLGFDWDEMLALGQEHLEERYKDFMKDGWAKL